MSRTLKDIPRKGVMFLEAIVGFTLFGIYFRAPLVGFVVGLFLGLLAEILRYRDERRIKAEWR
jgi:hypothetical protein